MNEPDIFPLTPDDARELTALLTAARPEYIEHLHPFPFTVEEIHRRLAGNREDRWWGLRVGGELAGFYMLRGWDDGFTRPAFGVFIAEAFARQGLARRALATAVEYCRAAGAPAVMLTVHPDNERARSAYEAAGFQHEGENAATGHHIYQLPLS